MAFDARPLLHRFIKLTLIFFSLCACIRFVYYSCTEGFSLQRIENTLHEGDLVNRYKLEQTGPTENELLLMKKISTGPFRYLKKGSQAYAFVNRSGRYILKLYKCHHLQSADWLFEIPTPNFIKPWRNRLVERRRYKLNLTVSSFTIARDILKEECGILYAQVIPSKNYVLDATLIDSIGRTYTLNLAQYGFTFQRRARLIFPSLQEWIEKGDMFSAKQSLKSLIGLIAHRSMKGVQDSDPDLHKNAGLVGTTAIFIDIGSFHLNNAVKDQQTMKRDIEKISKNLAVWLSEKSPELHAYLLTLLEEPWKATWEPIIHERMEDV